jgi:hypothetical protein
MVRLIQTVLTCLALVFAASAAGMRAPALERVEATEATAISINQLSLQNLAVFRRGYSIVCYQNISEREAKETADNPDHRLSYEKVVDIYTSYKPQTLTA